MSLLRVVSSVAPCLIFVLSYPVLRHLAFPIFNFISLELLIVVCWEKDEKFIPRILVDYDLKDKFPQIGTTKLCYVLELIRKQNAIEILSIDNNLYVKRLNISHLSPLVAACRCDNIKYTVLFPSPLSLSFSIFLFLFLSPVFPFSVPFP